MNENIWPLILLGGGLLAFLLVVSFLSKNYSLNNFKNKTVGDGQHGTARWATPKEIHTTYHVVPFRPRRWRKGEDLPAVQGIILGSMGGRKRRAKRGVISQTTHKLLERLRRPTAGKKEQRKPKKKKTAISKIKNVVEDQQDVRALVDSDDIHCLMIGASGVGKTAYFLYANLEYASASGMSYLALDTKGDLARNYGAIASRYYGYKVSVIDLRNPTRSDGFNFLTLMNHYMDIARMHPENLAARARAEKYPILSDLYNAIQESYDHYDGADSLYPREMLRDLLLGLHSMCRGADARFFNGHTNIDRSKFLVFCVKGLDNMAENLRNTLLFSLLSYMSDQLLTLGNSVAAIDELYLWLSDPTVTTYIRNALKRVRKKESALFLASQNLEDFTQPGIRELTRPLFSIPVHQFIFNGGNVDKKFFMDNLQLEESEYALIRGPQRGSCLYKCGNERYLLQVQAPEYKQALSGTAGGR